MRDGNALESGLARPRNKWVYGREKDLAKLAASYAFAIIKNHPYSDGNKRIGFLAMATFLGINGREFNATDTEVVTEILKLAGGHVSEEELSEWIRRHSTSTK